MNKSGTQGSFLVIDGPDGCGKSTQVKLLAEYMRQQGVPVDTFRDPGTTVIGEEIRRVLLDPANHAMSTRTELLLYMAARAQLWAEKISPALSAGHTVILDRWLSSTCAYQGYAGGFGIDKVSQIAEDSLERAWPDLTIILDVDPQTAAGRLKTVLDRMELKGLQYHQKVRQGFLELARIRNDCVVIDASADINATFQKLLIALQKLT